VPTQPAHTAQTYLAFLGYLTRNALLLASGALALRTALDAGGGWWLWWGLVLMAAIRHAQRKQAQHIRHKEQDNAD
jgi:fatty acid desaturase